MRFSHHVYLLHLCSGCYKASLNLEKSAQTKDESVVSLTSVFPFNLHPDQNATVFVFRANLYWTVSTAGTVRGPLPLLQRWPHLPAAIEAAAFSPMDFKWYFFKGAGLTSACKSHGAAF